MAPLHCPPYHHHLVGGGKEDAAFEPRIIGFRIENIVPGRKDATHVLEAGGMTWRAPSHRGVPERPPCLLLGGFQVCSAVHDENPFRR